MKPTTGRRHTRWRRGLIRYGGFIPSYRVYPSKRQFFERWRKRAQTRAAVAIALAVLLVPAVSPLFGNDVFATSLGPSSPTSAATVPNGGTPWSNPANTFTRNSVYASVTMASATSSDRLEMTGYGFNINSNATINGIVATSYEYGSTSSNNSVQDGLIYLMYGGSPIGNNQANSSVWPSSVSPVTYGSSGSTWGASLTPAKVNSSTFGVAIEAQNVHTGILSGSLSANVDYVSLTVYYTLNSTFNQASYRIYANQDATLGAGASDGFGWANATTASPWATRDAPASVVFNNRLWVMGGGGASGPLNDVWSSADGVNWTEATADAPWAPREGSEAVVYNSKIWIMGGDDYVQSKTYNDVWWSADGTNWTQATAAAAWATRSFFGATVFNGKMWVVGGQGAGSVEYNNVYSSSDGVTWTLVSSNPGWPERDSLNLMVYNNELWVTGGWNGSGVYHDVWSSADGATWTSVSSGVAWPARQGAVGLVYNSKMWIMGGDTEPSGGTYYDDVWSSTDGITWTESTPAAGWSPRAFAEGAVMNSLMWIMGGDMNPSNGNDVWYSTAVQPIDVGAPLAALNTPAVLEGDGEPFRVRLALAVGNTALTVGGQKFALQYAQQSGGSCSATPSANFAAVTNTSTGVRWYQNLNSANGQSLQTDANDPTDGTNTVLAQTYQQENTSSFTNSSLINLGQDGMWDFALETYHSTPGADYCLRVTSSTGTQLTSYTQYPEVSVPTSPFFSQGPSRWLANDVKAGLGAISEHVGGSGAGSGQIYTAALDSTDRYLYLGGTDQQTTNGNYEWHIEKRTTSGTLVPGFGTDGSISENLSTNDDGINVVAVDTTGGYLYVGGYDESPSYMDSEWRIEKRDLTTGALVTGFGTGGVITENLSSSGDSVRAMAIDPVSGYLYVAGHDSNTSGNNFEWRIEKRNLSDGSLVSGFGTGGVVAENVSANDDDIQSMVLDTAGGYLYAGGYDEISSATDDEWRIEKRDLTTGALVSGFGTGGAATENIGSSYEAINDMSLDTTNGYLYAVGYDENNASTANEWRIEKRSLATGALASGFGTGGGISERISSDSSGWDLAYAVETDPTNGYLYAVGYDENTPYDYDEWRIEKRDLTTGALVSGFGTGGAISEHISSEWDDAYEAKLDPSDGILYVMGSDEASGGYDEWRIESRNLTDGALAYGSATPLAATAQTYDAPTPGTPMRLRMLVQVGGTQVAQSAQSFTLQYGLKANSCSTTSYSDVTTATPIQFYSQAGLATGEAVVSVAQDPTDGGRAVSPQSYQDSTPFTNNQSLIYAPDDGLWDFSLRLDPSLNTGTDICLRVANSDGSPLAAYNGYAEIQYGPTTHQRMRLGKWFDSNGKLQPFFMPR